MKQFPLVYDSTITKKRLTEDEPKINRRLIRKKFSLFYVAMKNISFERPLIGCQIGIAHFSTARKASRKKGGNRRKYWYDCIIRRRAGRRLSQREQGTKQDRKSRIK
ncbi:MAG: hypothetical protein Q3M30_18860 [Candidatus Electrothrix sp. Rat3]|nr:hypothetical protein [Candidatus Electrothrix rattekaaiensis]